MAVFPQTNIINNKGGIKVDKIVTCIGTEKYYGTATFTVDLGTLIPRGIAVHTQSLSLGGTYGVAFFDNEGNASEMVCTYENHWNNQEESTDKLYTRYISEYETYDYCYIVPTFANGILTVTVHSEKGIMRDPYSYDEQVTFYVF